MSEEQNKKVPMDSFTATMIAEGQINATEETYLEAFQFLIDTGLAWQLQGSFGRQAAHLIEQGLCNPPPSAKKVGGQ